MYDARGFDEAQRVHKENRQCHLLCYVVGKERSKGHMVSLCTDRDCHISSNANTIPAAICRSESRWNILIGIVNSEKVEGRKQ